MVVNCREPVPSRGERLRSRPCLGRVHPKCEVQDFMGREWSIRAIQNAYRQAFGQNEYPIGDRDNFFELRGNDDNAETFVCHSFE